MLNSNRDLSTLSRRDFVPIAARQSRQILSRLAGEGVAGRRFANMHSCLDYTHTYGIENMRGVWVDSSDPDVEVRVCTKMAATHEHY